MRLSLLGIAVLCFYAWPGVSEASQLEFTGAGDKRELVVKGFPKEQVERYAIFKARCTACHSMDRPLTAVESGVTPISGQNFNKKEIKRYIIKMMRKANSGISKSEARDLIFFMTYLRELSEKKS